MKKFIEWLTGIFFPKKEETPVIEVKPTQETKEEADIIINPDKKSKLEIIVKAFHDNRDKYYVVSHMTGVPEDVIFAIHYRESSLRFNGVLHNGENIIGTGRLTRLVPKGRGPFSTWEEAAIDALEIEKRKFPESWDLAGKLDFCEKYNGLGYRKKGLPSPYVYNWTNKYAKGKYVRDGIFDPNFVDQQCGTAAIILSIGI